MASNLWPKFLQTPQTGLGLDAQPPHHLPQRPELLQDVRQLRPWLPALRPPQLLCQIPAGAGAPPPTRAPHSPNTLWHSKQYGGGPTNGTRGPGRAVRRLAGGHAGRAVPRRSEPPERQKTRAQGRKRVRAPPPPQQTMAEAAAAGVKKENMVEHSAQRNDAHP